MAAGSPGARGNAQWGYEPTSTGRVTFGGTSVGWLSGPIDLSIPREYAFLKLDQDNVDIDAVCIKKDALISFGMDEPLLANLQYMWDNDAAAAGPPAVLTVDDDMGSTVALVVNQEPPGYDGSDTRVISMPRALGIGPGNYTMPYAAKSTLLGIQFKGIGNSDGVLITLTDTYA